MMKKTSCTVILGLLLWAMLFHAQPAEAQDGRAYPDVSHGVDKLRLGGNPIYKTGFGSCDACNTHRHRYRSVGPFKYRYYRKKFEFHHYSAYHLRYRSYGRYSFGSSIYPYRCYRYSYGDILHKTDRHGYHPLEHNRQLYRSKTRYGTGTRFNSIRGPSTTFRSRFTFRRGFIGR